MRTALADAEEHDPQKASVDKVLPGLNSRLIAVTRASNETAREVRQLSNSLIDFRDGVKADMKEQSDETKMEMANVFIDIGSSMMDGIEPELPSNLSTPVAFHIEPTPGPPPEPEAIDLSSLPTEYEDWGFKMKAKHRSLFDLWAEWHGLEHYKDAYGGIAGRDEKHGTKWRIKNDNIPNAQYSRTKRVIFAIKSMQQQQTLGFDAVLNALQPVFEQHCNHNMQTLIEWFIENGWLRRQAQRGRKRKPPEEPLESSNQ